MPGDKITPWLRASTFLRKGPKYLCAYAGWRARRLLRSRLEGPAAWPDASALAAVLPSWQGAPADLAPALRAFFASRRSPAPLCNWSERESITRAVPEAARERTIVAAGRIVERRFRYRGQEAAFHGPVDWSHRPAGNLDWTWDLNRHHFFVVLGRAYWYTGDERYAKAFSELLAEWMAANPPSIRAPAWRSVFEAGVRVANWCWAHSLFLPSPSIDDKLHLEIVRGILGLGRFLEEHIERHAWNNHLLLEAKALAMAGLLYPELPGAASWRQEGLALLKAQLDRQVLPDGVHSERSSLYHSIIASELLEHLFVLRLAGRGERDSHYCAGIVKLVGMAIVQSAITRSDGTWPLLGDSSRGDEHVRFDAPRGARILLDAHGIPAEKGADENLAWLFAALGLGGKLAAADSVPSARARHSRVFKNGGVCILESGSGAEQLHLVFDCGPFGDPIVPGHGHADALSIDVAVGGRQVLVDPGMYSPHLGESWRNFFRGTSAHNTIVVDGKDQTILRGLRRVYRPARVRLLEWASCGAFDVAAGLHLGYLRLVGPVTHRREIFFRKGRWWLVVDRLEGEGQHSYDLLFHLPPGAGATTESGSLGVTTRLDGGPGLAILPVETSGLERQIVEGVEARAIAGASDGTAPQGWVAFESGVKEPAPVVGYRRAGAPPVRFATLLVPFASGDASPAVEAIAADEPGAPASQLVAGRLRCADGAVETFLAAPVLPPTPGAPARLRRAGDLETDAMMASAMTRGSNDVEACVVFRGNELRWKGASIVKLAPASPQGHFAFEVKEGKLEVHTTGPVLEGAEMTFGGLAARAGSVQWNGAEAAFRRHGDELVLVLRG